MLGRTFCAALIACIGEAVMLKQQDLAQWGWGRFVSPPEVIETSIEPSGEDDGDDSSRQSDRETDQTTTDANE